MEDNTDLVLINAFRRSFHLTEARFFPFKGQGRILGLLHRHDGVLSQRELMDMTEMKSSSLSELTTKLSLNGYITKETDPEDRRNTIIRLTAKGQEKALSMKEESRRIGKEAFSVLSDDEKQDLTALLRKLIDSWKGQP